MYSLDCTFFKNEFNSREELINYCNTNGVDPNYEITRNGKGTGENLIDIMQF